MYADWQVAEPDETKRTQATWEYFVAQIQAYYKLTENLTLKNHQFRTLTQATHEAFPAFCNRVYKEALKNSWDLPKLRKEGMQIESVAKGVNELNNESPINKMGKYSYKNMKKQPQTGKTRACYYCGQDIKTSIIEHVKTCRAKTSKCNFLRLSCDCLGRYWGKHQRLWKERSQTMESSPEDGRNPSQNQTIQQPTHTNSRHHQMRRNVR